MQSSFQFLLEKRHEKGKGDLYARNNDFFSSEFNRSQCFCIKNTFNDLTQCHKRS